MQLTRIPLKLAIFANPVTVHPRYGAQLSLFDGIQKNNRFYEASLNLIPELNLIETVVRDTSRDPDGHHEVRYVNLANTIMLEALDGMIELEQEKKPKQVNRKQRVMDVNKEDSTKA